MPGLILGQAHVHQCISPLGRRLTQPRVDSCHGGIKHAKVPGCILSKGILDQTLGGMGILLTSSNKLGVASKGLKPQSLY